MSFNKEEIAGIGFSNSMLFMMLLNLRQRHYILSKHKIESEKFIRGLSSCEDVKDYFDKFYFDHEFKSWGV